MGVEEIACLCISTFSIIQMFNAYIRRVIIEIDGHVYKVRYKCPRGFFGYGMVDGEVQEID